ncbi:MAG: hypothetical protein KJ915_01660 [Candidatus Omnitrophica bacterium]|nr:hypothetical protein [Candidatus Omnitrophota bacterium]
MGVFFGQESLGMAQIRGNGVLVLTDEELFFKMWAPAKELSIKLSDIIGLEMPKSFLSKTKFKPLLKIMFKNQKKQPDAAAWLVGNLSDWHKSIQKTLNLSK